MLFTILATCSCEQKRGEQASSIDDQRDIQGEWTITSCMDGGKVEGLNGARFVFTGDSVNIFKESGEEQEKGTFKLDPSKAPKWIDFTAGEKNRKSPGIYELKGDSLRICLNGNVAKIEGRPTKFASEVESPNDTLIELRRAEPIGSANNRT